MSHPLAARPHCTSRSPRSPRPADPALLIGDVDREQTSSHLGHAFTRGYLLVEDYQDRLERALQARTVADLSRLTADLPVHALRLSAPARQAAHQHAALRGVPVHVGVYLLTSAVALLIWLAFAVTLGAWYFWPIWPLLGGAAGVASHALPVAMGRRARARADSLR